MPKRGISSFSMENLLSPVPKNFIEEPICVSQTFLYRKFLGIRGGGEGVSVTIFRQNGFCLTVSNYFLEEPICVSQKFLYRKILGIRGGGEEGVSRFSVKMVFVSQYQIIS